MSSVDERVVNMRFNNAQFEAGVKQTLDSISSLNQGLSLEGTAAKGVESLGRISNGIESIAGKFGALSIAAVTALTNIINKGVDAGLSLAKSLTIDPITSGLQEYETNLNSIQTILANTQASGAGLKDVNAALDELNHYSDQTIYNFEQMARNIGTFTAAGVGLQTSVSAIKGIANLAALSGSSAEQASTAMYQLSQAISSGKVSLEDWNSVVNAGMGGTVFQRALAQTAVAMGAISANAVKLEGPMQNVSINGKSFRDSIMAAPGKQSWLTSDVLLNTLKEFTGDLSDAQLKAMGFKDDQIAAIQQMAQTAKHAATEVKTMSGVLDTAKEAAGSGWSETWRIVFGDFEEAKTLFTNVSNAINGFIGASSDARNKVLKDWKDLGGRTSLIYAIKNAFTAVMAILTPIKQAFRQIFPATTGKQLMEITTAIRTFSEKLIIGGQTADKIHRIFAGLFAVLDIGWQIIKNVVKVIFDLIGATAGGAGGFLDIAAKIGDFLVKIDVAIKQGNLLTKFFDKLGSVLSAPIKFIGLLGQKIASMFDGVDSGGGSKFLNLLKQIWNFIKPIAQKVASFFKTVGTAISDALSKLKFKDVLNVLDTAAFTSIAVGIGIVVAKIKSLFDGGGGGEGSGLFSFLDPVKEVFEGVTESLKQMQNTLKAASLIEIAIAVGLLTIALVALSKLNADQLTLSLSAIGIMFTQLIISMKELEAVTSDKKIRKMIEIGIALTILAIAIDILAGAVKKLAVLDWQGLVKGLSGLLIILAGIVATVKFMPDDKKLFSTGLSLLLLAASIKVLVSAVTDLAGLSWEALARGLVGVGVLLGSLLLFEKFMEVEKGGIKQGVGILLLATSIKILSDALIDISKLSWEQLAKGLAGIAGGLAAVIGSMELIPDSGILTGAGILIVSLGLTSIADSLKKVGTMDWGQIIKGLVAFDIALGSIASALDLIPPSAVLSAVGILITAYALQDVANVLQKFGDMNWGQIGKSLVELAGALAIIAGGLYLMEGALLGAAALIVVAAALDILAPVLIKFGNMSWESIGKGLIFLAGAFVVLAIGGALLAPVVPVLILFAGAVVLFGAGMFLAGVGILAFSAGLTALALVGSEATTTLAGMVTTLAGLIPMVMVQLALGIIAFANVIATAGPQFTAAIVTVLISILNAIDITAPKIVSTLFKLLSLMLDTLVKYVPKLTDAGLKILIGFLTGIANNIGKVVDKSTDVIVAWLNGISHNLPRIIQAGVDLIINFVNGLADAIRNNKDRMNAAGENLASAIIDGMISGLGNGIDRVKNKAKEVAKAALDAAMHALDAHSPSKKFEQIGEWSDEGFANGLDNLSGHVAKAAANVGQTALDSMSKSLSNVADIVSGEMDMNPTITPVLDLTNVQKNAGQINNVLSGLRPIELGTTYSRAKDASAGYQSNQNALNEYDGSSSGLSNLTFIQNNTSPKALSSADIYRQTNNQLSRAKGALAPSA